MLKQSISDLSLLLVDDESFSRLTLLRLLKNLGNPDAVSAENGSSALDMLEQRHYTIDCVISDFNMPIMHGLQLLKKIRCGESGIRRTMPVIMLTGHSETVLVKLAIDMDVTSFIVKPVTKQNLLPRLEQILKIEKEDDSWLKPVEEYRKIDVDTSIMEILAKNAETQTIEKIEPEIDNSDPEGMLILDVESLCPGHYLLRSVTGDDGQVYIEGKTSLTERHIQNLRDLVGAKMIKDEFKLI